MDERALAIIRMQQEIIASQNEYIAGIEFFFQGLILLFMAYAAFNLIIDEWHTIQTFMRRVITRLRGGK